MTGHDKGRDCARTDEVLDNYRRRAVAAERELITTRGPGRPSTGVRVDIRIPADLLDWIDSYAAVNDMTRAEALREAVAHFVTNYGTPK
jgi:hypothetical protein